MATKKTTAKTSARPASAGAAKPATAPTPPAPSDPSPKALWRISVTGQERRRRAGMSFGRTPVEVDPATLSVAQRKALEGDRHLKITKTTPEAGGVE